MLTYCITVDLGKIVNIASVSSNYSIENPYYLHKGSNWSRDATRDIGIPPLKSWADHLQEIKTHYR